MPTKVYVRKGDRTYVYSSESYWSAEKKAPRSRMTYLGVLQDDGSIVKKREAKKKEKKVKEAAAADPEEIEKLVLENEALKTANAQLKEEMAGIIRRIETELGKATNDLNKLKELL